MNIKQYSPDNGFTKKQMENNYHTLWQDVKCPFCGKLQPVSMTQYIGGPCFKCGKRTDGSDSHPTVGKEPGE